MAAVGKQRKRWPMIAVCAALVVGLIAGTWLLVQEGISFVFNVVLTIAAIGAIGVYLNRVSVKRDQRFIRTFRHVMWGASGIFFVLGVAGLVYGLMKEQYAFLVPFSGFLVVFSIWFIVIGLRNLKRFALTHEEGGQPTSTHDLDRDETLALLQRRATAAGEDVRHRFLASRGVSFGVDGVNRFLVTSTSVWEGRRSWWKRLGGLPKVRHWDLDSCDLTLRGPRVALFTSGGSPSRLAFRSSIDAHQAAKAFAELTRTDTAIETP